MTKQQRAWNLAAIYCVAALQMGGAGLSPVLAELGRAFPSYSDTAVQFVMTVPSITVVLTNLFTGKLCELFPKKYITAVGCALAVAFALLGRTLHGSLVLIYAWAAVLGVGTSLACTVSPAIVNEMFEPQERVSIFGVRACASSVGTMLMTFAGGYLVAIHWSLGFLVYLIMIPGLLLSLFVHPKDTRLSKAAERRSAAPMDKKALLLPCLAGFCASMFYSVAMVNASMLVAETGFVAPEAAAEYGGLLSTAFLAVGGLTGIALNKLTDKLGLHCITLGFGLIAAGYAIIFFAPSYAFYLVASVLTGGAITLVMPHAQILGSDAGGAKQALGLSITLLFANLGTLLSPLLTSASAAIFGTSAVRCRFLLTAGLALLACAVLGGAIERRKRKRNFKEQP